MTHQAQAVLEGVMSSCQDARDLICDGGGGAGGGRPLQVWTYLASGYSDDKSCGAGNLTVVFRQCAERVCTRRLWGAAWQQTLHHHFLGSSCFSLTWAKTCRGPNSTLQTFMSAFNTLKEALEHRNAHLPWPALLLLLIYSLKSLWLGPAALVETE